MSNSLETLIIISAILSIAMIAIVIGQNNITTITEQKAKTDLMHNNIILSNSINQLISCGDNCTINVSFPSYTIINKSNET